MYQVKDIMTERTVTVGLVRDYMTRDAHSLEVDASLDDAAAIFCGNTIRRIPIVRDGRLVGILSRRDLIRFVREVRGQAAAL